MRGSGEGTAVPRVEVVRYLFHREHKHPLVLAVWTGTECERDNRCNSCREPPSGPTYSCGKCGFYLHKSCTGNPDAIGSPLHDHTLTRDFCTGSSCSYCSFTDIYLSNFYKCLECDFALDQKCALTVTAPPGVPDQETSGPCPSCRSPTVLIEEEEDDDEDISCIVCHVRCRSGPIFKCAACKFSVHESCSACLLKIRHPTHPFHRLKIIKLCLFKCGNCLGEGYGTAYHCEVCDFDLDFKCAFLVPREEFEGKEEPILLDIHPHPLARTGDTTRSKGDCIICYEPCPLSTYSCRLCNFDVDVHKSCANIAKLPKVFHHPTGRQERTLRRSDSFFTCKKCLKDRSGYYYELSHSSSGSKLDVRCAYLERPVIVFDWHSHPLIFHEKFDGHGRCDACGKPCTAPIFHCPTCGLKLHLLCGPLPCSIKQETGHQEAYQETLVLKDSHVEDWTGYEEFFCDCCEEKRDPHECVYSCIRRTYHAEIKCVMPELKHALMGESGDVDLRTLGRWSHSGKVLSKGLLSEMQQSAVRTSSMDTKPGCYTKDITCSLTGNEKKEFDDIFDCSQKLFDQEDLSRDGDLIRDARPYSDGEFIQLVEKLESVQVREIRGSWESNIRFVHVGEYLVPQHLVRVYDDLYRKYGDLAAETKLSPRLKALLLLPLCQTVEGICSTKVVDITEGQLIKWWISVKAVRKAGFKIQFAVDALKTVVRAYYGLLFRRGLDQEIRSLEEVVPENKATHEKLAGELKHHKEYFGSEEPSLVKDCMVEALSLMYKTAAEVALEYPLAVPNKQYEMTARMLASLPKTPPLSLAPRINQESQFSLPPSPLRDQEMGSLLKEINHPAHPHSGPLTLGFFDGGSPCSICGNHFRERDPVYRCSDPTCHFKVDRSCSSIRSTIEFEAHRQHPLCFVERADPGISCRWCQKEYADDLPMFRCGECGFSLHLFCGPLPCAVQCRGYELTLTDSLIDNTGPDDCFCDNCEEQRDPGQFVYYNHDIRFKVSVSCCLLPQIISALRGDLGDIELQTVGRHIPGKVVCRVQVREAESSGESEIYGDQVEEEEESSLEMSEVDRNFTLGLLGMMGRALDSRELLRSLDENQATELEHFLNETAKKLGKSTATGNFTLLGDATQRFKEQSDISYLKADALHKKHESRTGNPEAVEELNVTYVQLMRYLTDEDTRLIEAAFEDCTRQRGWGEATVSFLYYSSSSPVEAWDFNYSDDAFEEFKEELNFTDRVDDSLLTGWKKYAMRLVRVGNDMIPSQFVSIYQELVSKHGDFSARSRLGPVAKGLFFHLFFSIVYSMRGTQVRDIGDDLLRTWQYYLRGTRNLGFEIQFALDDLEKLVRAHFGLKVVKFRDETTEKLEKQVEERERQVDEGEAKLGQLKSIEEKYRKPKEAEESLVQQCLIEAAEWKWKDVGDLIL